MPTARVGATTIYYELSGDGPRLLAIPGSNGDLRQRNVGAPLAQRFTVLTLDQRGLGQTVPPPQPWTMADYADDIAGLLDHVGWDRCHVLGVSFGGMVAQELAIRHPQRVERLVLACTSSGGAGGASAPLHEFAALPLEEQVAVRMEVLDRRHDAAWRATHPEAVEAFRAALVAAASRDEVAKAGVRGQLEARATHDTYERLPQIAAPTLVAAGRYDGQAPPENQPSLVQRIPNARVAWFEGGHGFLREDPSAYPAVAAFLLEG